MKQVVLLSLQKLKGDKKKYVARFNVDGRIRTQKFGSSGHSDYTKHRDRARRERYISRHKKDLKTGDPTRAGYLSMYILWGQHPSVKKNRIIYERKLKHASRTGRWKNRIPGTSLVGETRMKIDLKAGRKKINRKLSFNSFKKIGSRPNQLKLYKKVVKEAKQKFKVWPSAYASGWVVKTYKQRGGTYSGSDPKSAGIRRWFREQWVNICEGPPYPPCGRKKAGWKKYPYCRPLKRISKDTPKTVKELTKKEISQRCRRKRANPRKRVT